MISAGTGFPEAPRELDRPVFPERLADGPERRAMLLRHRARMEAEDRRPFQFPVGDPRQARRLRVGVEYRPVHGIEHDDAVGDAEQERPVFLGFLLQRAPLSVLADERGDLHGGLPEEPEVPPAVERTGARSDRHDPLQAGSRAKRKDRQVPEPERPDAPGEPAARAGPEENGASRTERRTRKRDAAEEPLTRERPAARRIRRGDGLNADERAPGLFLERVPDAFQEAGKGDAVGGDCAESGERPEPDVFGEEIVPVALRSSRPGCFVTS